MNPIMEAIVLEPWHFKVRSKNKRKYNDGDCKHILAVERL